MHEQSGIDSWKGQNFYPQQLYQFQGPKSDISIGDEGLPLSMKFTAHLHVIPRLQVFGALLLRGATQKFPKIGMPHENGLLYSCVLLSISAKRRYAVRRCAFLLCIFVTSC